MWQVNLLMVAAGPFLEHLAEEESQGGLQSQEEEETWAWALQPKRLEITKIFYGISKTYRRPETRRRW
jgi:hypothetical protein